MAFSATFRTKAYLAPGLVMTVGEWTGAAGDAAGTLDVSGTYIVGALFFKMDTQGNTNQVFPGTAISTSGNVSTLTIQNQDNVTAGRFIIIHGGS